MSDYYIMKLKCDYENKKTKEIITDTYEVPCTSSIASLMEEKYYKKNDINVMIEYVFHFSLETSKDSLKLSSEFLKKGYRQIGAEYLSLEPINPEQ